MRHLKKTVKLGRTGAHRDAMLANQVCSLIAERRIKTTISKAKATQALAEKMVTLGKAGTLSARRQAIAVIKQPDQVKALFEKIAPGFAGRSGGYTRITKLGQRMSDASEMVILEWVESAVPAAEVEVQK
ncbi:MAG: 50S ribosomal protein L17 [Pontiellaceae bacterium]|jgi:large subunit ribosomal protein L17|nr:50S ribosomal protein L17 [Pontiellaceae bacterium]